MIELRQAYDQLETVKELFREYAVQIQVDLCFQNFEEELASLPGKYALQKGRIVFAYVDDVAAGVVARRAALCARAARGNGPLAPEIPPLPGTDGQRRGLSGGGSAREEGFLPGGQQRQSGNHSHQHLR